MDNIFDQTMAFTKMWTDMMGRMWGMGGMGMGMGGGNPWQPTTPPPDAARQFRTSMLQSMSQSFDEMMRSPQMLEWMKQSMDAAMTFRKQFNDMLTQMRHETQGVSSQDIDHLMRAMRHLEQRVLDRVDDVQDRLDQIAERLDVLEDAAGGNGNGVEANGEANGRSRIRRRTAAARSLSSSRKSTRSSQAGAGAADE